MQTCSKNLVTICMQEAHLTLFAHKELSQDCSRDWSVRRKILLIAQETHGCLKHTQCLALVTQLCKNGSRNGNPLGQAGWERERRQILQEQHCFLLQAGFFMRPHGANTENWEK